jgi:hypothetical protein
MTLELIAYELSILYLLIQDLGISIELIEIKDINGNTLIIK